MVYVHNYGVVKKRLTITTMLIIAGLFAFLATFNAFSSVGAAPVPINGCSFDQSGSNWTLEDSCVSDARIDLPSGVTLNGDGNTISASFAKTSNSKNAALGVIGANNVTIENLVIDGAGGLPYPKGLHGINVYESVGVIINDVTIKDMSYSGIVVNSSEVSVANITTEGNGWHGINVDKKTANPAVLNIDGPMNQTDMLQIYVDDASLDITVNDTLNQYTVSHINLGGIHPNDELYTLNPKTANQCKKGGWEAFGFKNQGLCIQYVNTSKDSRVTTN